MELMTGINQNYPSKNNLNMKKIIFLVVIFIGFTSCQNETKESKNNKKTNKEVSKPSFDKKAYEIKGKKIAIETFKLFKGKIEEIGKTNGLDEAVNFCHNNAQTLTDSIGKANNVSMRRASHKLRNSKNKPNIDQLAVINNYLEQQETHKDLIPMVMKDDKGFVHFYAPIKLKKKCLQCHGKPIEQINEKILKIIKTNYPDDKATGFREGELRGIWDIKFLQK